MTERQLPSDSSFVYTRLPRRTAQQLRSVSRRFRRTAPRSVANIIDIGNDLRRAKSCLDHGQFGHWLRAEFGWTRRMAQHFLNVAIRFGPECEIISHVVIHPTAAYLLAAPSVPERARELALKRACEGSAVTVQLARDLIQKVRGGQESRAQKVPSAFLRRRLRRALQWYQERWRPEDLAAVLREFIAELERPQKG